MKLQVLLGRVLYSFIFLLSAPGHFKAGAIAFAASQGTPMSNIFVPLSGVLALAGGLSILLGYKAKGGAWLIVLFLVPVSLIMHRFWGLTDMHAAMMQKIMFLKNMSMLGGALLITHFGSGPFSLKE